MSLSVDSIRKRFLNASPAVQYAVAIGGASSAALSVLALMYPDRAIFDEPRPDIPHRAGWPLIGSFPDILKNMDSFHHFALKGFEEIARTTYVDNFNLGCLCDMILMQAIELCPIWVYREILQLQILVV
jgi:hypothetical protein